MATSLREVPVHDLHLERSILNSMIVDEIPGDGRCFECNNAAPRRRANACYKAIARLKPEQFYSLRNQAIFRAIRDMYEDTMPCHDITLIYRRIADTNESDAMDMFNYLVDVLNHFSCSFSVDHYCRELEALYHRRQKAQLAVEAADLYRSGAVDEADALLTKVTDEIESVDPVPTQGMQVDSLQLELSEEIKGRAPGVTTGFERLNRLIGGFKPAGSYVLAGLTSMGKTALALQLVTAAALSGEPVHYWSLEMSATQLLRRMAGSIANVPLGSAHLRKMTEEQRELVDGALTILRNAPLTIDDKTRTLPAMIRQARRKRGDVRLYVVDHARLVEVPSARSEYQAVTEVSSACKSRIAATNDASIMILSQFNREAAKDGGQGKSHQLRGSGALEEDADVLMTIGRESYQGQSDSKKATLNVVKNRLGGECGIVKLEWDSLMGRFYEPKEATA